MGLNPRKVGMQPAPPLTAAFISAAWTMSPTRPCIAWNRQRAPFAMWAMRVQHPRRWATGHRERPWRNFTPAPCGTKGKSMSPPWTVCLRTSTCRDGVFHWYAYDPLDDRFTDLSAVEPGGTGAEHGS